MVCNNNNNKKNEIEKKEKNDDGVSSRSGSGSNIPKCVFLLNICFIWYGASFHAQKPIHIKHRNRMIEPSNNNNNNKTAKHKKRATIYSTVVVATPAESSVKKK